jgi:hypothetical protein
MTLALLLTCARGGYGAGGRMAASEPLDSKFSSTLRGDMRGMQDALSGGGKELLMPVGE